VHIPRRSCPTASTSCASCSRRGRRPYSGSSTCCPCQEEYVFRDGPLGRAIAASIALPAIFQPVVVDDRALLDGGLVNPLPFDLVAGQADIVVAVDVTGAPHTENGRIVPAPIEALIGSTYIFERTIVREKLRSRQPDVYIDAQVSHYQLTDFLRANLASEPALLEPPGLSES